MICLKFLEDRKKLRSIHIRENPEFYREIRLDNLTDSPPEIDSIDKRKLAELDRKFDLCMAQNGGRIPKRVNINKLYANIKKIFPETGYTGYLLFHRKILPNIIHGDMLTPKIIDAIYDALKNKLGRNPNCAEMSLTSRISLLKIRHGEYSNKIRSFRDYTNYRLRSNGTNNSSLHAGVNLEGRLNSINGTKPR